MSIDLLIETKGTVAVVSTRTDTQDAMAGRAHAYAERLAAEPVFIDTLKGDEQMVQGREGIRATHMLFFRGGTTINETDRFVIQGHTYDGAYVDDPHAFGHHVEAKTVLTE